METSLRTLVIIIHQDNNSNLTDHNAYYYDSTIQIIQKKVSRLILRIGATHFWSPELCAANKCQLSQPECHRYRYCNTKDRFE